MSLSNVRSTAPSKGYMLMPDIKCINCCSSRFEIINDKTYCVHCGVESLEPWSTLNPDLRKMFMKNFNKNVDFKDPKLVSALPALAEYLKEINSENEEEEEVLPGIKNCSHCHSEALKPYKGQGFCLNCARLSDPSDENDNLEKKKI